MAEVVPECVLTETKCCPDAHASLDQILQPQVVRTRNSVWKIPPRRKVDTNAVIAQFLQEECDVQPNLRGSVLAYCLTGEADEILGYDGVDKKKAMYHKFLEAPLSEPSVEQSVMAFCHFGIVDEIAGLAKDRE